MRHFAWIIDVDLFPYLKGTGGVSASYVLPKAQSPSDISLLAGAAVWILLRSRNGDILFSRVHVSQVDQFEDGYNSGDFLLSIDQSKSYRLFSDLTDAANNFLVDALPLDLGVNGIPETQAVSWEERVLQHVSVNFRKPPDNTLNKIALPPIVTIPQLKARQAIANATANLSLEEVWATKSPVSLPPFAYFVYAKMQKEYGKALADELAASLARFDPIPHLAGRTTDPEESGNSGEEAVGNSRAPSIDTVLTEIDIEKLYARRFIAREKLLIGLDEILQKTEQAEKYHQDMLRDIASFLRSQAIVPLQSSSIDLSVEVQGQVLIFEIKSANQHNIYSQSAKGLFQLVCYKHALTENGRTVGGTTLILQKINNSEIEDYLRKVFKGDGISVLFYDASVDWPERLDGLTDFLKTVP